MHNRVRIVTCIGLGVLTAGFLYWAFTAAETGLGLLLSALCCALYGCVFMRFVPAFADIVREDVREFPDDVLGPRSLRFSRRHPWLQIALCVLITRVVLYGAAYFIYTRTNGYQGGLLDMLQRMWLRTDAPSYLGIAENGYVTAGDARFHMVFFPLYPLCIRGFSFLTGNYFAAAMLASNAFTLGAAIACYELTALELPRADALRCVRYMLLLPAAFFLGAPMGESLFLFLCLLCLYFLRLRKYVWSCSFAALAGFARMPGVLLLVPIAIEMAAELADRKRRKPATFRKKLLGRLLCLCIVPLGLAGYLYINYRVWGDPLQFLTFQREHWDQAMAFFWNPAAYQSELALSAPARLRWGLYLPNLLAAFGALWLMVRAARDMRASYSGYFLAYFAITMGVTWLLSAPRYLTVCYPLMLACALLGRDPQRDILLTALCACALIGYMGLYVLGYPVY